MNLIVMSNKMFAQDFRKYLLRAVVGAGGKAAHVYFGTRVIIHDLCTLEKTEIDNWNENAIYQKILSVVGEEACLVLTGLGGNIDPAALVARKHLSSMTFIYDIYDDFRYGRRGFEKLKFKWRERAWVKLCDFNIVLEGSLRQLYPDSYFLYNASHVTALPAVKTVEPKKLVYIGSLDERIDFDWLEALVEQDITLDIYGRIHVPDPKLYRRLEAFLRNHANVCYHGEYENDDLPTILNQYRVGIVPYKSQDAMTRYINPDKIYHYLNAGLEVVAPPFPQALRLASFIHLISRPFLEWKGVQQAIMKTPRNVKWPATRCTWATRWSDLQVMALDHARHHPVRHATSLKSINNNLIQNPRDVFLLQLGCGIHLLEGWCNTDLHPVAGAKFLDFSKRLSFPDQTVDAVFCERTIEHISKKVCIAMFREVFRVLKPGGVFRIVTMSLDNMAKLALAPNGFEAQKYLAWYRKGFKKPEATLSDAINWVFQNHEYEHIYMWEELDDILKDVGFVNSKILKAGEYHHPVFKDVDSHGKLAGEDINSIEVFAIEVEKPAET